MTATELATMMLTNAAASDPTVRTPMGFNATNFMALAATLLELPEDETAEWADALANVTDLNDAVENLISGLDADNYFND